MGSDWRWLAAAAAVMLGIVVFSTMDMGSSPASGPNLSPPGDETCEQVRDVLTRLLKSGGGGITNPAPGVLTMPPQSWTGATHEERDALFRGLAIQKACAAGVPSVGATAEVRSRFDNRLLASGTAADYADR